MATDPHHKETAADIRGWFGALKRQGWIVVVCALLTGAAAYFLAERKDTKYQATSQLLIRSVDAARSLPGVGTQFSDPTRTRASNLQLIRLPPVARGVERELQLGLTTGQLIGMVRTNSVGDSDLISITATSPTVKRSVDVANAFADVYVRFRRVTNRERFREPIRVAQLNLQRARQQKEKPQTIAVLRSQLDRMRLLGSLETADAQVVARAGFDSATAIHPETTRITGAGALVGVVIGLLLALLRERLDDRIRREDELETALGGLPVLGRIPLLRGKRNGETGEHLFQDLRVTLEVLLPRDAARSLLVTSAGESEGKSSTAANLALAMAQDAEPGSVLLVDGDVRRPELTQRLAGDGARPGKDTGLSHVIEKGAPLDAEVQRVSPGRRMRGRGLRVAVDASVPLLTAGRPSGDTQKLFDEDSAGRFVEQATRHARTVIIDGAPLGLTADMLPMARKVTAVIVVARLHRTRRRDVERLLERLATAQVTPLGLVLVGVGTDQSYY